MNDDVALLFAPGAGAPSTSPWMKRWKERLSSVATTVATLDYPYALAGRRSPDPLPKLIAAHTEALVALERRKGNNVFLIGKSMGGRVGCHVSLSHAVRGVICLGYPLKGAGKSAPIRDEVLLALKAPILFVQGTRDPLCPLPLLETVRAKMSAPNELFVVDGGNHSLEVDRRTLKSTGSTQDAVDDRILAGIAAFVKAHAA